MRTVETHLLEDKMDEAVTHYINSHHPSEPVHIDTNGIPMTVQDDGAGRVTIMHQQTYTTQMCRQVSVTEQVGDGPWGEELLEGPIAAIVAHLQNSRHHPPPLHKVAQVRSDVDTSVILDGTLRFNGQPLEHQTEPIVVQLPPMQTLPPLQDMKRCADADWFTDKNKKDEQSMLHDSDSQVLEMASSSPAQNRQQSRKSLPHKKRISRKLKRNNGSSTPQQEQLVVINCSEAVPGPSEQEQILPDNYVAVPHAAHISHEVRPVLICQICGEYYGEEQLKFYHHLKQHYEPHHTIIIENPVPDLPCDKMSTNCIVDNVATLPDSIVELSLENTVPKTLYQPIDKHILYTSSDKTLTYNSNKMQYSMASMVKEGAPADPEADKADLYDTLDKLELYNCGKCSRTFRKQKQCEAHMRDAHPINAKCEDMGEFSEPEDLMAGIQVCVGGEYEAAPPPPPPPPPAHLLPHLTVENGHVHQDHAAPWYGRAPAPQGSAPGAGGACGGYCDVCAREPDTPYKLLKEEVLQRIFDSEVSDNANFADNMMSDHDVGDQDHNHDQGHENNDNSHGHNDHVRRHNDHSHEHNERHMHNELHIHNGHSQIHNDHLRHSEHSQNSQGHNDHDMDHNEFSQGHNEQNHDHGNGHEQNDHGDEHNGHSQEHNDHSRDHNDHNQNHHDHNHEHNDHNHEHNGHSHEHNGPSYEHNETSQENYEIIKQEHLQVKSSKHFFCTKCDRVFTHRNSLLYHLLSHGGKQHSCRDCGKEFYTHGALKIHRRVHNNVRPYKCEVCGRDFRQWSDLKYHNNSLHSDKKHFKCEYCGKEFARKYSLNLHVRIHTGEKNFKCDHCSKTFRCSSYLITHMRTHTGDRPHKCHINDCEKSFRSAFDLRRHSLIHDKIRNRFDEHKTKPKDNQKKTKMTDTKEEKEEKPEPPEPSPKKIKHIAVASTTKQAVLMKKTPKPKKGSKKEIPNVTVQNREGQFKINDEFTNNIEVYDGYAKLKNIYSDRNQTVFKEQSQRELAILRPIGHRGESLEEKVSYKAENTDGKMQVFTHVEKGKDYSGSIVSNAQVLGDMRHLDREVARDGRTEITGEGIETGFLERLTAMYNIPAV